MVNVYRRVDYQLLFSAHFLPFSAGRDASTSRSPARLTRVNRKARGAWVSRQACLSRSDVSRNEGSQRTEVEVRELEGSRFRSSHIL